MPAAMVAGPKFGSDVLGGFTTDLDECGDDKPE